MNWLTRQPGEVARPSERAFGAHIQRLDASIDTEKIDAIDQWLTTTRPAHRLAFYRAVLAQFRRQDPNAIATFLRVLDIVEEVRRLGRLRDEFSGIVWRLLTDMTLHRALEFGIDPEGRPAARPPFIESLTVDGMTTTIENPDADRIGDAVHDAYARWGRMASMPRAARSTPESVASPLHAGFGASDTTLIEDELPSHRGVLPLDYDAWTADQLDQRERMWSQMMRWTIGLWLDAVKYRVQLARDDQAQRARNWMNENLPDDEDRADELRRILDDIGDAFNVDVLSVFVHQFDQWIADNVMNLRNAPVTAGEIRDTAMKYLDLAHWAVTMEADDVNVARLDAVDFAQHIYSAETLRRWLLYYMPGAGQFSENVWEDWHRSMTLVDDDRAPDGEDDDARAARMRAFTAEIAATKPKYNQLLAAPGTRTANWPLPPDFVTERLIDVAEAMLARETYAWQIRYTLPGDISLVVKRALAAIKSAGAYEAVLSPRFTRKTTDRHAPAVGESEQDALRRAMREQARVQAKLFEWSRVVPGNVQRSVSDIYAGWTANLYLTGQAALRAEIDSLKDKLRKTDTFIAVPLTEIVRPHSSPRSASLFAAVKYAYAAAPAQYGRLHVFTLYRLRPVGGSEVVRRIEKRLDPGEVQVAVHTGVTDAGWYWYEVTRFADGDAPLNGSGFSATAVVRRKLLCRRTNSEYDPDDLAEASEIITWTTDKLPKITPGVAQLEADPDVFKKRISVDYRAALEHFRHYIGPAFWRDRVLDVDELSSLHGSDAAEEFVELLRIEIERDTLLTTEGSVVANIRAMTFWPHARVQGVEDGQTPNISRALAPYRGLVKSWRAPMYSLVTSLNETHIPNWVATGRLPDIVRQPKTADFEDAYRLADRDGKRTLLTERVMTTLLTLNWIEFVDFYEKMLPVTSKIVRSLLRPGEVLIPREDDAMMAAKFGEWHGLHNATTTRPDHPTAALVIDELRPTDLRAFPGNDADVVLVRGRVRFAIRASSAFDVENMGKLYTISMPPSEHRITVKVSPAVAGETSWWMQDLRVEVTRKLEDIHPIADGDGTMRVDLSDVGIIDRLFEIASGEQFRDVERVARFLNAELDRIGRASLEMAVKA